MLRQIALDTETTGKSDDGTPGDHRIIEVGCVEIIDRKLTGREMCLLINPEREVDPEATQVHGFTYTMLQDKPVFANIAHELIDFITGAELLIHNAKFDTSFLDKEWMLLGLNKRTCDMCKITDTIALARKIKPNHQVSLDNLCRLYEIDTSARTKHGALLDAQLLAEVYLAMTGGQSSFDFGDVALLKKKKRWQRPEGAKLPLMTVSNEIKAVHIDTILTLAQRNKLNKIDDEHYEAGSNWSADFNMPYLEKGKEESKKDYGKRLAAQKSEMLAKLLTDEEQEFLKNYLERDRQAHLAWEERVKSGH